MAELNRLLVLGVGNMLLRDDGVGPYIVTELERRLGGNESVEFVDGGTVGLPLLRFLAGRRDALLIDAFRSGAVPGTVTLTRVAAGLPGERKSTTAHESNVGELLTTAALTGELPGRVTLLGIEPKEISTGVGFSSEVQSAIPDILHHAEAAIRDLLGGNDVPCSAR